MAKVTHENGAYCFEGFTLSEDQAVAVLARYHALGQYNWTQRKICDWLWTAHRVSVSRPQLAAALRALGVTKHCIPVLPHQTPEPETIRANLLAEADAAHRDTAADYWQTRALAAERKHREIFDAIAERIDRVTGTVVCDLAAPVAPRDAGEPYTAVLLWSDWHLGQNTRATQTRVIDLLSQIADHFQADRRPIDRIWILVLGDMLDGAGEADTSYSGQTADQDVHGTSQIELTARTLAAAVGAVSQMFGGTVPVSVACVAGNHGRTHGRRNADRDRICEWSAYRLASEFTADGIDWRISTGEAFAVDCRDTRIVITHGDRAAKDLRALRWGFDSPAARWYLVACGHFHAAAIGYSEDGRAVLVRNGALCETGSHGRAHGWTAPGAQSLVEISSRGPALARIFRIFSD